MRSKNIFSYLCFVLLYCFFASAFAKDAVTADPILTPINGLSVSSNPGQVTITNTSGKDIAVSSMLLSFSLEQTSVPSIWGSPWLNWRSAASLLPKKLAANTFQFINQANLPNNMFSAGSNIVIQYSPSPWNSPAVATNVQLFNVNYPLNPASIKSTVDVSGGVTTITITNTSDKALSLAGAQLRMTYEGQIHSSIWGTPWANWSVGASAPNYVLNAGTSSQIPVNGTITVAFQGDALPIANIALWVQGVTSSTSGQITLNFPATPPGATNNPTVTLTGPTFPQGQTIIGTWGQPYVQKDLQVGTYTFSAAEIKTSTQTYLPSFTPNPVVVSGSAATVNLMYAVKELGNLYLQIPGAPGVGLLAPTISITGPDLPAGSKFVTSWGNVLQVCANGATTCNGISAGNYTLSIPYLYSNTDAYVPMGYVNPVIIKTNETTTVPLTYATVPKGNFTVTISYPTAIKKAGKKSIKSSLDQTFDVTFTNLDGHVFTKTLVTGINVVSLPINDTYIVTAPNVAGRLATATPSTLSVSQTGTPPVSIQYNVGSPTKFAIYYGGWGGDAFNLNTRLPSNVTSVILSFANITANLQVDTSVSGWLTNIPAPNTRMQPTYVNWTVYKNNHPNTKVLLAIGGATFSAIWNSVLTPANADAMAKSIADVVNRPYPVYKSDMSYPADLIGNVYIDGVDLDVETGGRLSSQVSSNVALLTTNLKKYLNSGKLITFAGFSVGADPNNSQCTVPTSIHCGEDIPLLQSVGTLFDWVNLMAYDAGQEYATSLYKVALANYAKYLPKEKILLGLDVQAQWPGFTETAQQLAVKAAWQKQNGYGGAMFWGVGVQNNPTQEQQYVDAISAAIN